MIDDRKAQALVDAQIGRMGTGRIVYSHRTDPQLVIKEGRKKPYVQNWTEWLLYTNLDSAPHQQEVLGKVVDMSYSGRFLIMERLDDLATAEQLSRRRYPAWHTDTKADAFGVNAAGDIRVRDFGHVSFGNVLASAHILDMPDDDDMHKWAKLLL
jgi:hypothetical protein